MSKKQSDNKYLDNMRHSAEHTLHMSVEQLYKGAKKAMGPATEDGFYHDVDLDNANLPHGEAGVKITEEQFSKIEKRMKEIIDAKLPIKVSEISLTNARKIFKGNPYKLEWLDDIAKRQKEGSEEKVTICEVGKPDTKYYDIDLCKGGHVKNTGEIGPFKLLSVAGAYWKGSEKNKMLTRIYGTAFPTKKELDQYLKLQEAAKKRDHRKLGKELDLFVFSDLVGKGLPLLTEKGTVIRRELARFIVDEEIKRGYKHVYTPDIAKVELYETSGHYPYYKDSMYPIMQVDEERLILRPMTCPHHFQLYASRPRSYKELPVRIAELANQYRYEKSGELSGLIRARMFTLADSHIICMKEQAEDEINGVLDLIEYIAKVFGLIPGKNYRYRLSKGDRKDSKKFYKDDKAWDFSEDVLRKALNRRKTPFFEEDGEAAFYGPKIDIQMKNVLGKEETAFTVQYDFVMPKRFKLKYIDKYGKEKEPVVIHRSSIGALERVIAFLIEHFAGAFPVWLSPIQSVIIPISDENLKYASKISDTLLQSSIRVHLDDRSESMQAKIRDAQVQKIPYMLIVGKKEEKDKSVSVRLRSGEIPSAKGGKIKIDKFVDKAKKIIEDKSLKLW